MKVVWGDKPQQGNSVDREVSGCGGHGGRCRNALTRWTVPFKMMLTFASRSFSVDVVECRDAFERGASSDEPTKYSSNAREGL